jgi:hypothetical protein
VQAQSVLVVPVYYFAIGDIIGTEKDKTDCEETTSIIIKMKRPAD